MHLLKRMNLCMFNSILAVQVSDTTMIIRITNARYIKKLETRKIVH